MARASQVDQIRAVVPGAGACLVVAALGLALNQVVPLVSPLLLALIVGIVAGNLLRLPRSLSPGLMLCARSLLRWGIVLLGLQISFAAIWKLGPALLAMVVLTTALTFVFTTWLARRMGLTVGRGMLIAAGCSICGASAIAGVRGIVDADEEDVAASVGIITFFGLLAIPIVPLLASLLRLPAEALGGWSGASIHEVAQVVAAAGTVGGVALSTAVIVKLTRVLLLAPLVAGLSALRHRHAARDSRPALVPWFVTGFVAMVTLRSVVTLPPTLLSGLQTVQTLLLAAAMSALGAGVHLRTLARNGRNSIAVGAISSAFILTVTLVGILLVS